jgi:hypothetical protein
MRVASRATGPEGREAGEVVNAKEGKLAKNVREGSGRRHGRNGFICQAGLNKTGGGFVAAGGETFHVLHDKLGPKPCLASKEEVFLKCPGKRVGPSHLPGAPAMRDGVVSVAARDFSAAVDAGGSVKVRMEDLESRFARVPKEGREERTLEAVCVDAEPNDGLGGLVKAED